MRLGRLAVAGLTAGLVVGFVVALLLPRRRRTVLDLTAVEIGTVARPTLHVEPEVRRGSEQTPSTVEQP